MLLFFNHVCAINLFDGIIINGFYLILVWLHFLKKDYTEMYGRCRQTMEEPLHPRSFIISSFVQQSFNIS